MVVITISGLHGTGKTTHARFLAERFGLRYVSAGEIMRRMAKERGMSLEEFSRIAEESPSIDKQIDERMILEAEMGNVVLDGRLTAWMAREKADIKIFLTAPLNVRVRRIAERENKSIEEALKETVIREESEKKRYREIYGIDAEDYSVFDIVVNTALWNEETVKKALEFLVEAYLASSSRGEASETARNAESKRDGGEVKWR
ncbi:MAG: AAA family ATPase [Candidatus Freyarchaeota archaeon]|nr:AAA family ATPase [Candidatus Jordarchaeia archaeon]